MNTGSCACKGVQFEIKSAPGAVISCFCSHCRKNSGHLGQLMSMHEPDQFIVTKGQDLMREYVFNDTASGLPKTKYFCGRCGCTILTKCATSGNKPFVNYTLIDGDFTQYKPTKAYMPEMRDKCVSAWGTENV